MFQIEVKKDSEAPSTTSKYAEVYEQLYKLQPDEWLVLSGFKDVAEMRTLQSTLRGGGSSRMMRIHGFSFKSRGYESNNGRIELWMKVIPADQA